MRRFQISVRRMLTVVVPLAVAVAMVARAATSWGPMNLSVLAAFVLVAAAVLACVPSIPHRPFWAGVAVFGSLYVAMFWLLLAISGVGLGTDPLYRSLAESHYGPAPDFKTSTLEVWDRQAELQRSKVAFIAAAHALTALILGIFGGCTLLIWANVRESRRWDCDALSELPLEDFLLPPLKIDPPLNSK